MAFAPKRACGSSRACAALLLILISSCTVVGEPPEEPRYFNARVELVLDNRTVSISHTWHCAQSVGLSAGDGKLYRNWYTSQITVVKMIEQNLAVFFSLPPSCEIGTRRAFSADIGVIRDVRDLSTIEIHPTKAGRYPVYTETLKRAEVERVFGPTKDTVVTEEEVKLHKHLVDEWTNYRTLVAVVVPEQLWKSSPSLANSFSGMSATTLAPQPEYRPSTIQVPFFPGTVRIEPGNKDSVVVYPMTKVASTWEIHGGPIGKNGLHLHRVGSGKTNCYGCLAYVGRGASDGKTNRIKYKDQIFPELQVPRELYDPSEKVLVRFQATSLGPIL